jgi:hypothetical protein
MKLLPILPICFGFTVSVAANCQVATPSVGYVRYANSEVRAVYGLPGNYIIGSNVLSMADAVSFSDAGGLLLNSGSLTLLDPNFATLSTFELDGAQAIARVDGGLNSAIAWSPGSHSLVYWNNGSFAKTPVSVLTAEDVVDSVRKLDARTASLLVAKPDGTIVRHRVSLQSGEIKASATVPNASGYAFETADRIICFKEKKLSVLSQTGDTLQTFALPVDNSFVIEQASNRCLHLRGMKLGLDWLLHMEGDGLELYRLPLPSRAKTSAGVEPSESVQ